jgi:hypothetical protein
MAIDNLRLRLGGYNINPSRRRMPHRSHDTQKVTET